MAEPIFIGGCGRSGTTLFVDLLGCHPEIAPLYEPWFVCNVAELIFLRRDLPPATRLEMIREGVSNWIADLEALPHDKRSYERYCHGTYHIRFGPDLVEAETERLCRRLPSEPPLDVFRDYVRTLFDAHAVADGKPRWAAKVPRFVLMLPLLERIFPDLRFFHCIRDPRATIASLDGREWAPAGLEARIEYWRNNVESGVSFADRQPDRCLEVCYEDLLSDTGPVLSRCFDWLGLPDLAGSILERYERTYIIDRSRIDSGSELDSSERNAIDVALAPLIRRFGY